jgi:hypothetical protein
VFLFVGMCIVGKRILIHFITYLLFFYVTSNYSTLSA